MSTLRYVPVAEYTFGCCHYGHKTPYRTADVKADSIDQARKLAHSALAPGITEHICHVETRPNPDHLAMMSSLSAVSA